MKPNFTIYLLLGVLTGTFQSSTAQTSFVEVSQASGIDYVVPVFNMGGGAVFFDYNNDDNLDVYITGHTGRDALYENNGDGTFTDVTVAAGFGMTENIRTMGVVTGDIDNDGFRDIYISTRNNYHKNLLFHNNGDGTFTEISDAAGFPIDSLSANSSSMGDFNLDGYLDIHIINHMDSSGWIYDTAGNVVAYDHKCSPNSLYLNNGDLTFTEVNMQMNVGDVGCGLATAFTDFDNDADVDIMVANDFGQWIEPNGLYRNEYPTANFTNVGNSSGFDIGMYGMGIAIGDYDHDLDLDYYITNIGANKLMQNNGDGTFNEVGVAAGVDDTWADVNETEITTGWGTAFVDFDNDKDLDLYVANGYITTPVNEPNALDDPDKLFSNNGDGTFDNASTLAGLDASNGKCRGMAYGDYDNDGDVDVLVTVLDPSVNPTYHTLLYKNDNNNTNNYLKVKLQGVKANRDGFGAHLIISAGGEKWVHEVTAGSSHFSQNTSIAHFGLGDVTNVESLEIIWPGGRQQWLHNVAANQMITVVEDTTDSTTSIDHLKAFDPATFKVYPNPVTEYSRIRYTLSDGADVELMLVNQLGQQLELKALGKQAAGTYDQSISELIDISTLPAGMYTVKMTAGDVIANRKLIIQ